MGKFRIAAMADVHYRKDHSESLQAVYREVSQQSDVLLLCGELGRRGGNGPKPLGLRQYNTLASWLRTQGMRPGDLLTSEGQARLRELSSPDLAGTRVEPLLERGAVLALIVERWQRDGLWVISRSDAEYPERLKRYLAQSAPPLLYGIGPKALLNRGGLAVVGSRDRSEEDGEFARRVGEACARQTIPVISGVAKGIDRDAMSGALEAGGWAVGVLAEGLAKTATSGQYRNGLVSDRLTLVSPYDPDSRWFAYLAMDRNKVLYGLSDAALVVASAAETGGTWTGATEALRRGRLKVYVKTTGALAPGNLKLQEKCAVPFPSEPWDDIGSLFTAPAEEGGAPNPPVADAAQPSTAASPDQHSPTDAYLLVLDSLLELLKEARTEEWLSERLNVRPVQMKDWLARGVTEGRIQKLKKPVRYVVQTPNLFTS